MLHDFISQACAPPPVWTSTCTKECEICEREVRLTCHHLIPRSTHAKVLKKKGRQMHPESMINFVAWLCRPCHSLAHIAAVMTNLLGTSTQLTSSYLGRTYSSGGNMLQSNGRVTKEDNSVTPGSSHLCHLCKT
ncbi:hypothetical protein EV702DRAFT_1122875 [Suillus placidus]|uniref:HNH endonuclease n=1 Tax=Suillus placidus TaxID=48579 RepID=A0A9P6ZPS3_9AGAM|nr:hypothetical protein EV702DRAFT_1122875 [Suillus placidus]